MEQKRKNEEADLNAILRGKEADILAQYRSEAEGRADQSDEETINRNLGALALRFGGGLPEASVDSIKDTLGSFFDKLSTHDSDYESSPKTPDTSVAMEKMRKLIFENFATAVADYKKYNYDLISDELLLKLMQELNPSRTKKSDAIREMIEADKARLEDIKDYSPEGYTVYYGLELEKYAKAIENGEIVRTPYVDKKFRRVTKNMDSGRPTFLYGDLGSGKTEMAIAAAKDSAISRAAYEDAVRYCLIEKRYNDTELQEHLGRAYEKYKKRYYAALRKGDKSAVEQFSPLFISGSKDLTTQDLFVDKSLKLSGPNDKSPLERKEELDELVSQWQNGHLKELDGLSAKEREEKERAAKDQLFRLYLANNQAYGTTVEEIIKPVARAVSEGRALIIDEVNAIPAAILISMNDILQRKPGETCYIPGNGMVVMKEGFSVTMTGNLETKDIVYGGTEDLNPAFVSRLDPIEYDYLPMSESDPGYDRQADPQKNELFHVAMSYLVDGKGNLRLPEMDESLRKLFALSQLAHQSQIIFEGKWRESDFNLRSDSGDIVEPRFEKHVLSLRNLIRVLKEWDKGSEKSLDEALWDGFINGITSPEEKSLMIGLAHQHGFFQPSEGWRIETREGAGAGATSYFELYADNLNFQRKPLETLSMMDVVNVMFGNRPERDIYPDFTFDDLEGGEEESAEEKKKKRIEVLNKAEKWEIEAESAVKALEVLYNQSGCPAISGTL